VIIVILVDLNAIAIANFLGYVRGGIVDKGSNFFKSGNGSLNFADMTDDKLLRHMLLNTLSTYSRQFKSKFGSIVLCCDSKHYWRKDVFPFYKAHRKKSRDDSKFDWAAIHDTLDTIKVELKSALPYKIIEVVGAEADDVIGAIVEYHHIEHGGSFSDGKPVNGVPDPILIISADQDFLQLQRFSFVKQYDPRQKRYLVTSTPELALKEKIIRGDAGDGIPSILSEDNIFLVPDKRQKPLRTIKVDEWKAQLPEVFCTDEDMRTRYRRNEQLIDLTCIPDDLKDQITHELDQYQLPPRSKLLAYCIEHGLREIAQSITDF
jgi:5'-3' exonuclease